MEELQGSVLDASALLAYLQGQPGDQTVQAVLAAGAVMNAVNFAEVLSRLADAGEDPSAAHQRLQEQGLIGGLITLVPVTEDDAIAIARDCGRPRGRWASRWGIVLAWPRASGWVDRS